MFCADKILSSCIEIKLKGKEGKVYLECVCKVTKDEEEFLKDLLQKARHDSLLVYDAKNDATLIYVGEGICKLKIENFELTLPGSASVAQEGGVRRLVPHGDF